MNPLFPTVTGPMFGRANRWARSQPNELTRQIRQRIPLAMITKTEVQQAITRCEPHAGFATIDNALVHPGAVSRGDLHALIEAAKCARYECIGGNVGEPPSQSEAVLDYTEAPFRDESEEAE